VTNWFSIQLPATHVYQGKAVVFSPVGEFNYKGYREKKKKNPSWKVSFTILVKVDVLEYVSWTN